MVIQFDLGLSSLFALAAASFAACVFLNLGTGWAAGTAFLSVMFGFLAITTVVMSAVRAIFERVDMKG